MKSNFLFIQAKPRPFLHFSRIFHQERFLSWDPDHVAMAGMFLLSHCGLCSLSHALLAVKWCFKAIHTTKCWAVSAPQQINRLLQPASFPGHQTALDYGRAHPEHGHLPHRSQLSSLDTPSWCCSSSWPFLFCWHDIQGHHRLTYALVLPP